MTATLNHSNLNFPHLNRPINIGTLFSLWYSRFCLKQKILMQAFGLYTVDNKHEMYNTNLFPLKFKHLLLPLKLCIANQMNALCIVFHSAIISLIFCMFAKTIWPIMCICGKHYVQHSFVAFSFVSRRLCFVSMDGLYAFITQLSFLTNEKLSFDLWHVHN